MVRLAGGLALAVLNNVQPPRSGVGQGSGAQPLYGVASGERLLQGECGFLERRRRGLALLLPASSLLGNPRAERLQRAPIHLQKGTFEDVPFAIPSPSHIMKT